MIRYSDTAPSYPNPVCGLTICVTLDHTSVVIDFVPKVDTDNFTHSSIIGDIWKSQKHLLNLSTRHFRSVDVCVEIRIPQLPWLSGHCWLSKKIKVVQAYRTQTRWVCQSAIEYKWWIMLSLIYSRPFIRQKFILEWIFFKSAPLSDRFWSSQPRFGSIGLLYYHSFFPFHISHYLFSFVSAHFISISIIHI